MAATEYGGGLELDVMRGVSRGVSAPPRLLDSLGTITEDSDKLDEENSDEDADENDEFPSDETSDDDDSVERDDLELLSELLWELWLEDELS